MQSYKLLLLDLPLGTRILPLKQGSEYSLNQLNEFAKAVLAFGSSDFSYYILVPYSPKQLWNSHDRNFLGNSY